LKRNQRTEGGGNIDQDTLEPSQASCHGHPGVVYCEYTCPESYNLGSDDLKCHKQPDASAAAPDLPGATLPVGGQRAVESGNRMYGIKENELLFPPEKDNMHCDRWWMHSESSCYAWRYS